MTLNSYADRVAHRGARSCAWRAPRARPRGQRSIPKLTTMLNTYDKI